MRRQLAVMIAVMVVFGPGIEAPVRERRSAPAAVATKDGAGVAGPSAIGGPRRRTSRAQIGAAFGQHVASLSFGGAIPNQDAHVFDAREMADDISIDPRDGREFPRPVVAVRAARRATWPRGGSHSAGMR